MLASIPVPLVHGRLQVDLAMADGGAVSVLNLQRLVSPSFTSTDAETGRIMEGLGGVSVCVCLRVCLFVSECARSPFARGLVYGACTGECMSYHEEGPGGGSLPVCITACPAACCLQTVEVLGLQTPQKPRTLSCSPLPCLRPLLVH